MATGLARVLGIGLAARTDPEVTTMRLTSPAFSDGKLIPADHTCDGKDASPPLAWDDVPEETQSFALLVTDSDADDFVHWLLTDIPADVRELPEGRGDEMGTPSSNHFGRSGWGGPCPPSGQHRYVFTLYALTEPIALGGGRLSADDVLAAAYARTLATGELTGVYGRRR
ncbi:MAG TPA: YbhB/YbcL family Raf kinase inhibitor-like protein [Candidatus Limnocylindria bacterium]|nr:YbhB/YbcL family Raf kinase inhibitor-like protein [Candidatus Limnocylindria bacterium]